MSLVKNSLHTVIFQSANQVIGVLSGILLTRLIGPEGKGIMSIFTANIGFLSTLLLFNLNKGLIYYGAEDINVRVKIFNSIFLFILGSNILIYAFLFLSNVFNLAFLTTILPIGYTGAIYIGYLSLQILAACTFMLFIGFYQASEKFKRNNAIDTATSSLGLIAYAVLYALAFIYKDRYPLYVFFICNIVISSIQLAIWLTVTFKTFGNIFAFTFIDGDLLKKIVRYSSVYFLGGILLFLIHRLDFWFVSYYRGYEQLGYYSLATNLSSFVFIITGSLFTVLFPRLSKMNSNSERMEIVATISRIIIPATLLICLAIVSVAWIFIPLLYGHRFANSVAPFNILLIGAFMVGIGSIISAYFSGSGIIKYNLFSTFLGVAVTIPLDFWLIPRYGIIGSSIATTLSFSVLTISQFIIFYKIKGKLDFILITKNDIKLIKELVSNIFKRTNV